jgi:hypothetical protein
MGEGGGDDDEEGESEDEDEDWEGTRLANNELETKRRNYHSFYFRTGSVIRTTSHHGIVLTGKCQVGGHPECKKIMNMPNGGTQVVFGIILDTMVVPRMLSFLTPRLTDVG